MTITVYTKPSCIACDRTKKLLDKNGNDYNVIDMSEDADALAKVKSLGFLSAPVVVVDYADGKSEQWAGYQRERISALA